MMEESKELNLQSYSKTLSTYGADDPRSVKWGTTRSQFLRFKILCEIADIADASILDFGCGVGDLYEYLKRGGFRGQYIGTDHNPDLLTAARQKYADATFVATVTQAYDYALISGVFNDPTDLESVQKIIHALFEGSTKGLAFNMISKPTEGLMHYDPWEIARFCQTLTPMITVRHDYRGGNFTVYLYKHHGVDF